jgi:hypothetical protein
VAAIQSPGLDFVVTIFNFLSLSLSLSFEHRFAARSIL